MNLPEILEAAALAVGARELMLRARLIFRDRAKAKRPASNPQLPPAPAPYRDPPPQLAPEHTPGSAMWLRDERNARHTLERRQTEHEIVCEARFTRLETIAELPPISSSKIPRAKSRPDRERG